MKKAKWHNAIDVATERFRKPNHEQIIQVAKELFPDEMKADDKKAVMRGYKASLRDAMRGMMNIDESDESLNTQTMLPGMSAPAYIGVEGESKKETLPVKYMQARPPERLQAIEQRELVGERIFKRAKDLRAKEEFMSPYIGHDFETTEETLNKISSEKKAS